MGKERGELQNVIHPQSKLGDRMADRLAEYAGSWTFIFTFLIFLLAWMILNTWMAFFGKWDQYPFILLNLVLSCVAALQAPVILMSQNRQTDKDRRKMEYDYKVNRMAERGIEEILERVSKIERKMGSTLHKTPARNLNKGPVKNNPNRKISPRKI